MKVLWVNNIAIPKIAAAVGMQSVPVGGWMVKLANEISNQPDVELIIAFPYKVEVEGIVDSISYFSFNIDEKKVSVNNLGNQDKRIEYIVKSVKPDCIHIFGTEKGQSYIFTEVAKKLGLIDKTVISIQGLTSICAKHYDAYLPHRIVTGMMPRDLYKGNVAAGRKRFEISGELEIAAIRNVEHVIGRTDWDRACTFFINPRVEYHFNNEMLRDSFYTAEPWHYENCIHHTLFMSQATHPLKGLHIAVEAVSMLKPFFPDIKLRVAGKSYTQKKKYMLSKYEQYVIGLISKFGLEDNVKFTGFLNEQQMVEEYKKANAFVCTSSIENSPNSVCEAMMLGTPVVCSYVGGVANLLDHGKEGFLFQADAPYMLAYYLKQIFEKRELGEMFSVSARGRAGKTHNVKEITHGLIKIYVGLKMGKREIS